MKNRKCPKCKTNTAEQTQGGITGGIWYQNVLNVKMKLK